MKSRMSAVALLSCLLFIACGPGGLAGGQTPASGPGAFKGKPAPEISLKTLDGKDAKLSALKGKVVVVDAWATWCPPCRESLPHLQKIADDKNLAAKGLVVWAANVKEEKKTVEDYLKTNKFTFTVLMDTQGELLKSYSISGIPTTLVVGRDGTVKEVFVGYGGPDSAKALDDAIAKALAEPVPAT